MCLYIISSDAVSAAAGGDASPSPALPRRRHWGSPAHDVTASMMESPCGEQSGSGRGGDAASRLQNSAGHFHSKRHKELENVALQSSLSSLRGDMEAVAVSESEGSGAGGEESPAALTSSTEPCGVPPTCSPGPEAGSESGAKAQSGRPEERSLTDHLNKRLLSYFLEKLNRSDVALPGGGQWGGEGDSNRALDEW